MKKAVWRIPDKARAQEEEPQERGCPRTAEERLSLAEEQIDRWTTAMERLRLADYVRYVDDRGRMFWTSFLSGVARGVGMAVGFTILGALLVLILQDLAKHNLPLIGDVLAEIVRIVQIKLD